VLPFISVCHNLNEKLGHMQSQIILYFDNEIEAQVISSVLEQDEIPHLIRSYHDSAYNGLWQTMRGWGHLEAPGEYAPRILDLYNSMDDEF
jgi:hypothetical protein